jgi:hypothetical protein
VDDSEVLRVARERFASNRDGGVEFFSKDRTDMSAKSLAKKA